MSLSVLVGHLGVIFQILSTLVTCYVAVSRSLCVIRPLKFKVIFTPTNTTVAMCVFVCASLCYGTIFSQMSLKWTVIDIYTGPVVTIGSLLIATGSVVAMLVCLKKISRFKNSFNITHNRVGVVSIPNEDEDDDIDNGEDNHDDGVVGAVSPL